MILGSPSVWQIGRGDTGLTLEFLCNEGREDKPRLVQ